MFTLLRKLSYFISLKLSDCLLTNSLEQLYYYKQIFPNKFSFYIPNSSSTKHLENKFPHTNKDINKSKSYKILWLGRFEEIKDPMLAIDTMRFLTDDFHLTISGSGSMLNQINKKIDSYELKGQINIFCNNEKFNLCEYDLILHTSYFEGLPNTFIEALTEKIPIVSTIFTTGLCELFIPYWIYPSERSSSDLAEKIEEALSVKHKKKLEKNTNIDQLISNYYNEENMFKSFKKALNNL